MGDHAPTGPGRSTRAHPGSRSRKRWRRLVRDDRGSAELVVATPLLLLLILGVIQFALYEHASEVAQTSAAQALAATRVLGGTTTSGRNEAESLLSSVGRGVLTNPVVSVSRGATTTTVTVTGRAEGIIPLLHLAVSASSSGPVERFVSGP